MLNISVGELPDALFLPGRPRTTIVAIVIGTGDFTAVEVADKAQAFAMAGTRTIRVDEKNFEPGTVRIAGAS